MAYAGGAAAARRWLPPRKERALFSLRCPPSVLLLGLLIVSAAATTRPPLAAAQAGDAASEFATTPLRQPVDTRDLRAVLTFADPDRELRVFLVDGRRIDGFPWLVERDTLRLITPEDYRADEAAVGTLAVPLADITTVGQYRSGAPEGLRWGAKSGAIVMGGLGLLTGVVVAAFADDDDSDIGAWPVLLFGFAGALAGAGAGSMVGGMAGLLTADWHALWPPDAVAAGADDPRLPHSRWCLEPGWSFRPGVDADGSGPGLRASRLRRLGRTIELGPCLEYHDIEGVVRHESDYGYVYLASVSPVLALGLDLRANDRAPGLRPVGSAGLGWAIGGDVYLWAHAGAGLRWRGEHGAEFSLIGRRGLPLAGGQDATVAFWAVSAGATF